MTLRIHSLLCVVLVGVVLAIAENSAPTRVLVADPSDPTVDTDGDLLPDVLEWVLLLDPRRRDTDGDGTDDFLHAVQHRVPTTVATPIPRALDHEMRLVATVARDSSASSQLWLHFLFRFVGDRLPAIPTFSPFLDHRSQRFPLGELLGHGTVRMTTLTHPIEGIYLLMSMQVVSEETLSRLMPCTIGVEAQIGGRVLASGSYLQSLDGRSTTLVPVGVNEVVVQTLAPQDADNPFWTSGRVCACRLSVISNSPSGVWCEIETARCERRGNLRCPPTCESSVGSIIHVADGLGVLTGGG